MHIHTYKHTHISSLRHKAALEAPDNLQYPNRLILPEYILSIFVMSFNVNVISKNWKIKTHNHIVYVS